MTDNAPDVAVTVRLARPLFVAAESATLAITEIIASQVAQVLDDLRIPRQPVVRLEASDGLGAERPIELYLDARRCRFPQTTIAESLSYTDGTPHAIMDADAFVRLPAWQDQGGADRLGAVLGGVCRSAVSAQPEMLLTPTADGEHRAVVELGMPLAGCDPAHAGSGDGRDRVEVLIAEQASPTIDLHIEPAYLHTLSAAQGVELFPFMRSGLFDELGLTLPSFRFRPDPSLRPNGFAFRINALLTPPRIGLSKGTILVNDTAERLALMNVAAEPAVNPATKQPGALVTDDHEESLDAAGLTTWDPFQFLILCFAADIRRRAHVFMTSDLAASMLDQVGAAFPALVEAVRTRTGADALAPVLRELLRDGVPVRNLRRILEVLLRYETLQPPCDRITFVRSGMADVISAKFARGTTTIVTYLLDPEIEAALSAKPADDDISDVPDSLPDRVIAATHAEFDHLPPTAQVPMILTTEGLRRPLAAMVRHEFPRLVVLSYGDLPPQQNVQPVARLSFT